MKTCGEYATEEDAVLALISLINPGHWSVAEEVRGYLLHPRMDADGTGRVRIDAILKPTTVLVECGWRWGFVGIECKKSEKKLGRVVSQAMDYTRCVWELKNGIHIMTRLVFIWPCPAVKDDLASVMVQNRIGEASEHSGRMRLVFNSRVAYLDRGNDPPRVANDLPGGNKTGSR